MKLLALVDCETGRARTMVVDNVTAATLMPIVRENVAREATIITDEHGAYSSVRDHSAGHGTPTRSAGEYVNLEDRTIHSNTVEDYFSIFKRGMKGICQHCGEQHLHGYLAEYEFRHNHREQNGFNDGERSGAALRGIVEKRITCRISPAAL